MFRCAIGGGPKAEGKQKDMHNGWFRGCFGVPSGVAQKRKGSKRICTMDGFGDVSVWHRGWPKNGREAKGYAQRMVSGMFRCDIGGGPKTEGKQKDMHNGWFRGCFGVTSGVAPKRKGSKRICTTDGFGDVSV